MHEEFPHHIEFQTLGKVPDGGGGYKEDWVTVLDFNGFLDTPTSQELFQAQQLNYTLDRNLFYPYRTDVKEQMRCLYRYDSTVETYELVSKPQDQGGQREIMKLMLKLVPNG
ncbi:phage head closure protein [Planococcus citreus]|uniref:SPP1 family predicted phage head-tail adaptor n=1 Tax=Planococcus citreus TaxID=1373 RepID=A0A497YP62_9BACL|nr:phage head closure protein [Planococcus citreus]RLJ90123.1 SPP1 family predicted phage head-tail adaptor [Planococcus citreus]